MNQLTFYKYSAIGLILLNIIVLGIFFLNKPRHASHPKGAKNNFQENAIQILNLDSEQQLVFNDLAKNHEKSIRKVNKQQNILLLSFFENIDSPLVHLDTTIILAEFGQIQRQKLLLTQQHLIKIKALLNEDQIHDYEVFKDRVVEQITTTKEK